MIIDVNMPDEEFSPTISPSNGTGCSGTDLYRTGRTLELDSHDFYKVNNAIEINRLRPGLVIRMIRRLLNTFIILYF